MLDEYYKKQKKNLEELYGKQRTSLTAEKQAQLQQAAVAQRLREKYLPNLLSAYGVENTGLAQSAYLDLQNLYGTQRGQVGQAYQTALSELESGYMSNLAGLEREQYQTALSRQQELYNDLSQYLAMSESKQQAQSLLDRYKETLSETQYKMLQDQIGLQGYSDTGSVGIPGITPERDTRFTSWISEPSDIRNKKGDNFSVSVGSTSFTNLELGSNASKEVVSAVKAKVSGGLPIYTLFISSVDNNVYIVLSDGSIKRVGGTGGFKVDHEGKGKGYTNYSSLKALLERRGQII